eukprot:scaffold12602_cov31-Cyclotella_meneghiniana.AAC.3
MERSVRTENSSTGTAAGSRPRREKPGTQQSTPVSTETLLGATTGGFEEDGEHDQSHGPKGIQQHPTRRRL